jgi:hypothetical protein
MLDVRRVSLFASGLVLFSVCVTSPATGTTRALPDAQATQRVGDDGATGAAGTAMGRTLARGKSKKGPIITRIPSVIHEDADFSVYARRGKAKGKTFYLQVLRECEGSQAKVSRSLGG